MMTPSAVVACLTFDSDEFDLEDSDMDSSRPAPTPLLDKYGRDLISAAENGRIGPAIARDKEIRAVARHAVPQQEE